MRAGSRPPWAALEGLSCATLCRPLTLCLLSCSSIAQGINQQSKGGCRLPAAWIIEVVSRERRAPGCEHPDEIAAVEVSLHLLLGEIRQPEAGRRVEDKRRGVEDELTFDPNP